MMEKTFSVEKTVPAKIVFAGKNSFCHFSLASSYIVMQAVELNYKFIHMCVNVKMTTVTLSG